MKVRTYRHWILFLVVTLILTGMFWIRRGRASNFVVNSVAEGPDVNPGNGVCATAANQCTLRAAIQEANALPGIDTITFNLGSGNPVIVPTSGLPFITDPVSIDGATGGATRVQIAGGNINAWGLVVGTGSAGSLINSLVIRNFGIDGMVVDRNVTVTNCFIGTDATGTVDHGNGNDGIRVDASNNTFIGNVISGNGGHGIIIHGTASGNQFLGNFIGTNAGGSAGLGNGRSGVVVGGSNNTIGGTSVGAGNVISGNNQSGVRIAGSAASGNQVKGNFIGTSVALNSIVNPIPNSDRGVRIDGAPNNTIGGTQAGARNIIYFNNSDGVLITGSGANDNKVQGNIIAENSNGVWIIDGVNNLIGGTAAGASNFIFQNNRSGVAINGGRGAISTNSIFSNGGLGIDLNGDGVTLNDNLDADTGPNNRQNFPVITSAVNNPSTNTTTVQGTLNSTANTTFTIELFSSPAADPSGYGEGQTFRGSTNITTNGSGNATFSFTLTTMVPAGHVVTATATDPGNNTSEFSRAVMVTTLTFSISGQITSSQGGAALNSVTMTLSGSQTATTQTDSNGNYSFTVQAGRNYTVTPSKIGFRFNPPSQSFTNLSGNVTANSVGTATPVIFTEQDTNNVAALDSVTFVRGPFRLFNPYNFSADQRTRIIFFTSDLGLNQPDGSVLTVQASGANLPVENVGTLSGVPGLTASYIVVRLPDGLPTGPLQLTITLRGVTSDAVTLNISP